VTKVNHDNQQLVPLDDVENSVGANPVGISPFQFAFQELALKGIALKLVERASDTLIERRLPLGHAPHDALSLIGEFELIDVAETP